MSKEMNKYGDILKKMQEMMADMQAMMEEEQSSVHQDPGAYHRQYTQEQLANDAIRRSEEEALITPKMVKEHSKVVSQKTIKALEYTGKFEKDKDGNVVTDEQGIPKKEVIQVDKKVESRNFNMWSRSINDMDEEEKAAIQRKALMNIHAGEDKIGNKDIRTRIVNDKIEFVPRYDEEEEKKRFKFTRVNEIDEDLQIPLCKFFINDELIYTLDMEQTVISNPLMALEYRYRDVNDEDKMDEVERLCHEIWKKTEISIEPGEVYAYLDSGYLINGPLEKHPKYMTGDFDDDDIKEAEYF